MMKYAIDRIIENIAILENINNNEIIEVNIKKLPKDINEGSIVLVDNGVFILDSLEEQNRRQNLIKRLENLKKKD